MGKFKKKIKNGDRKSYSLHKEPIGCISPPLVLNSIFGPQCQAESRGVIKNLILVGTIITLVALVRHVISLPE